MEKKFRLHTGQLFLTYAKCPIPPKEALLLLEQKLPVIEEYVVAHELHQDGTDHLHCWFKLASNVNYKRSDCLDLVYGDKKYHGMYEGARSNIKVLKYVTKDGNYISSKPYEYLKLQEQARESKVSIVGKMALKEGRISKEMIEQHPSIVISGNLARVQQNLAIYKQVCMEEEKKSDWWPADYPFKPEEKQAHYWIWGPPNTGKTSLLESW